MRVKFFFSAMVFALLSACSAESKVVGEWVSSKGSTFVFHDDGRYEQIGSAGGVMAVGEWWLDEEESGVYTDYQRGHSSHPMHWQFQEGDMVFLDQFSGNEKYRLSKE